MQPICPEAVSLSAAGWAGAAASSATTAITHHGNGVFAPLLLAWCHQMQAEVIRRFPGRYDIPSVTEIAGVIGNLVQQRKKGEQASS